MTHTLQMAYSLIDAENIDLLSIDIFDTLLWRKVTEPKDLFLILGRQLKNTGWLIPAVAAEGFSELRERAEQVARHKKEEATGDSKEITLRDIYWLLHTIFPKVTIEEMVAGKKGILSESDVDELVNTEVDLEYQLIEFNPDIVNLITYAHKRKIPTVLVSDTFFEMPHIKKFLSKSPSISKLIRKIYLSCEYGSGKRDGLFKALLADKLVKSADRILHIGDHPISDSLAAQAHGMLSLHYNKYDKNFKYLLEQEWPQQRRKKRMQMLDPQQGDFGVSFLRARLRNECPTSLTGKDAFFWKYGASVMGPVLAGFILRVFQRCHELGETRAFCLMREGRLYADMIRRLAPYLPQHTLEPIELWASRRFISHAALTYGSVQELFALTSSHPSSRFTVETFCHYLGLTIDEVPQLKKWRCVDIEGEEFRLKIAQILGRQPHIRDKMISYAAAKRQRFLKYLSTYLDLSKPSRLLLVDGGWSGTIQGALHVIFATQALPITTHGLYLNTDDRVNLAMIHGDIREGYILKGGYPEGLAPAVKQMVLEQTAMARMGPLIDIDDEGHVITAKSRTSKKQQNESLLIQQGIFAFCDRLGQEIQNGTIVWNTDSEQLEEQLRRIIVRATSLPTKEEANHFRSWGHDPVSMIDARLLGFGQSDYYQKFIGDMVPTAVFEDIEMVWPAAYAAQKDPHLTRSIQAVQLKTVPKGCFLSQDTLPLNIFLDIGKGFGKAHKKLHLRSNSNRHFYAFEKCVSLNRGIQQLRLVFPSQASLQIKSLRIKIKRRGTPETTLKVFFEDHTSEDGLQVTRSAKEGLVITCPFDDPDIYQCVISLCFSEI